MEAKKRLENLKLRNEIRQKVFLFLYEFFQCFFLRLSQILAFLFCLNQINRSASYFFFSFCQYIFPQYLLSSLSGTR